MGQRQAIRRARRPQFGREAALAAPFKPKDADLFSVISSFDSAYSAYNGYQAGIERYWTLKYLQQNGIGEIIASAFRDNLVRADELPLVLPALGAQGLPRGARVRVKLGEIDEITLDISGTVIERLDIAPSEGDAGADEDDGELGAPAGPISIAVDMGEADGAGATAALPV